MDIEWGNVRHELVSAVELIEHEVEGEHQSRRLRDAATEHIQVALLLITGSSTVSIRCRAATHAQT